MNKNKVDKLRVLYAQAVYDNKEIQRVVRVLKEHREAVGRETDEFEKRVAPRFGKKYGVMVNSGSSANLLAFELLNLPPGSEVITPLLTFSTTLSPLIKMGLIPVFADVEIGKYVIDASQVEKLITKKTKAIMIPLILGNLPDMKKLSQIAKKYKLFFVEDSCDTFEGLFDGIPTGKYSDITTTSFYGSHIITAASGGGMIMVNSRQFRDRAKMLRGWGRQSSTFNESENIEERFKTKINGVVYDAKFVFSEIGYNFLPIEISAAFGNAQLDKLAIFRERRKENFKVLFNFFRRYQDFFILPVQDKRADTQWLAFPLTIKNKAPFARLEIVKYLEEHNIQTRPVFTGNVLKQPGFKNIKYKIFPSKCPITEEVMKNGFVIGCHQGLKEIHLQKIQKVFDSFIRKY